MQLLTACGGLTGNDAWIQGSVTVGHSGLVTRRRMLEITAGAEVAGARWLMEGVAAAEEFGEVVPTFPGGSVDGDGRQKGQQVVEKADEKSCGFSPYLRPHVRNFHLRCLVFLDPGQQSDGGAKIDDQLAPLSCLTLTSRMPCSASVGSALFCGTSRISTSAFPSS